MRTPVLFLGIVLSTASKAQITMAADDMPAAGDTLRYVQADPFNIALDQTGVDMIWDYGDLVPQAEGADTAVSVGSTPFLYQLFFNNALLFPQHRADYATVGPEFDLQALSLTDVYDYYRADGDGFFNVGFGANVNGLPTSVRREPVDRIHAFPLEFGDTDTSPSSFNVSVPTVLYFGQDQVRTSVVDGWGTLILPTDTFDVLRVKSTLQRTDTIFIQQFGLGFRLPEPETVEYKWIASGMGKPVLEVVTTGGIATSAEFYYAPDAITTGVASLNPTELHIYPNPAQGELFVTIPAGTAGRLEVRDVTGRLVEAHNVQAGALHRLSVQHLANGAYALHVIARGKRSSSKLVVER